MIITPSPPPPFPLLKSLKNFFKISETLACPQGFQCGIRGTCIVDPLLPKSDPKCRCEKDYSYMKDGKCVGKFERFYVTLIPSHAKRSWAVTILTLVVLADHKLMS